MASDIYVQFADIKGDSQDKLNEGWIEVESVNFGFGMPVTGERSGQGAATTGKVAVADVSFTKTMDTASLPLMKKLWTGAHFPKVEFKFYRATGSERVCYLRIELTDAVISSVGLNGMNGSGLPGESYSINYGGILVEYTPTHKGKGEAQPKPLRANLNRITNKVS